jgi:hypothetical protein
MGESLFPSEAIALIRQARYDPEAELVIDMSIGAFVRTDENYSEFATICRAEGNQVYWQPVAFRDSVIFGWRHEECYLAWAMLWELCPEWPGFRPERTSESLRSEYDGLLKLFGPNY